MSNFPSFLCPKIICMMKISCLLDFNQTYNFLGPVILKSGMWADLYCFNFFSGHYGHRVFHSPWNNFDNVYFSKKLINLDIKFISIICFILSKLKFFNFFWVWKLYMFYLLLYVVYDFLNFLYHSSRNLCWGLDSGLLINSILVL